MNAAAARLGPGRLRLAVVGSGISGLVAARLLATRHDVTVFEAADRMGGHTHTVDVEVEGQRLAVDTGFIVSNEPNYPSFTRILRTLGVATQPTTMGFSVRCDRTGLEYCGSSLGQLFAQRRNLLRPRFWGLLRDVLRFHREAPAVLDDPSAPTLGELLRRGGYGRAFAEHYLVPMAAAIWSAPPAMVEAMPAHFLVRFFRNHGMLQVRGRPLWRTVVGGSRRYLQALAGPLGARVQLASPVAALQRRDDGVVVQVVGRPPRRFDGVVVAAHADQALAMLADPLPREVELLGAIPYQRNEVVLHTDAQLLPRRRRCWAAWNYLVPAQPQAPVAVTYSMNILQRLPVATPVCITLNRSAAVDPARVLRRFVYEHPLFDDAGVRAQQRLGEVAGVRRTWFCGAWCGNGFHEDGVAAALRVVADFGLSLDDLSAPLLEAAS